MDKLKNKLFNYAVEPPADSWDNIVHGLDNPVSVTSSQRMNRYLLPIAAVILIILLSTVFFINKNNSSVQVSETDSGAENNMTTFSSPDTNLNSGNKDFKPSESFFKNKQNTSKYITIASADGKPVQISSKVAALIVSSDNQYPPKTVWSAKVNRWKARMLANPVTPTTSNFLDIADLTEALNDQNSDN